MPAPNENNILCVAFDNGWFWYIPLSDTLTSVGAVVRRDMADKVQGDSERAMRALIDECPMISDYLSGAKRVTDGQYGQLRTRKDYSYHQTEFWRPGFALVGDAACFVDPVFSSGVHLATYGALLAARAINSTLAGIVDERAAMQEFEYRYRREYAVFYEFLISFYEMHRSENSYFWAAKKVTNNHKPELEAFVDLVGGVSSGETALANARTLAQRFKSRSREFASAVDEQAANKELGMIPLFRSSIVKQAMSEGARVQYMALMGDDAEPETPLFDNGLVASPDGMFWSAH